MDPGLSLLQSFTITVQLITFVEMGVMEVVGGGGLGRIRNLVL